MDSEGKPNAPKHQHCQKCGAWTKRSKKTMSTAEYYCTRCHTVNIVSLKGGNQ